MRFFVPRFVLPFAAAVLSICSGADAQTFRFAWLSDTHIGSTTGAEDLQRSVQDINAMNDVAFVLLSGDITEMGTDEQLSLAKTILDSLKKPYFIVPGNHDTKWSESGCTTFRHLWGNDRFVFDYGGYRFVGMHQGPIMKMGDGHFAPEDLRWVDSVLNSMEQPDQLMFFVTHYPLDPGIDNWYSMTALLRRRNVQAVLVGHGHRNKIMDFEGLPGIMGRSNLRANASYGGYTVVTVEHDSLTAAERTPGIATKPAWHTLALGRRTFEDSVPASRPDFSLNSGESAPKVVWRIQTGYTIASTPAVWNNRVIVGNSSGAVGCYSLDDGSTFWTCQTGGAVYSSPAAGEGKVVFGSADGNIYCLDVESGKQVWAVKTTSAVLGAAAIREGVVYIGASDRVFRALDLKSGSLLWSFDGLNGFVETRPAIAGDLVVFGAWDSYLYALSRKDGSLRWRWSNENPGILYSPAAVWPVIAGGKVFIAAADRYMTALDTATGAIAWRTNRFTVRESVGMSEDGERVFARCMNDTVVAFSAAAPNPEPVWITDCKYGYDIDPSMPVESQGTLFFGTKNGLVYALNGKTGCILWNYKIGVTVVHTPAALNGNMVLASDLDGQIVLLKN